MAGFGRELLTLQRKSVAFADWSAELSRCVGNFFVGWRRGQFLPGRERFVGNSRPRARDRLVYRTFIWAVADLFAILNHVPSPKRQSEQASTNVPSFVARAGVAAHISGMTRFLPILPLRDIVVFPHRIVPLFVGREKSVAALEAAMAADKELFLVAQLDPG
jgi:hypothetical protein